MIWENKLRRLEEKSITPKEARIVAHVCGDGTIGKSHQRRCKKELEKHSRKQIWRNTYVIRYSNKEATLRKEFANDVSFIYKRKAVKFKDEVEVKGKWIFERLKKFGAGKSYVWFIGKEIIKSTKNVKSAWLRAFFDDEATVDIKYKRIRIKCMNYLGLKQVKNLLSNLGVESKITGQNIDKSWYLTINKMENLTIFKSQVGFNHPKKIVLLSKFNLN